MAPVVYACRRHAGAIEPIVCVTGQHREMLAQVMDYFGIQADISLDVMRSNQTLAGLTSRCLETLDEILVRVRPNCVLVQGDTTTVMAASLAAFYRRIPIVHVEAGLRTGNLLMPWPEELNRRIADLVTALYCAPTQRAADALLAEGALARSVHITGNTIVDALLWTLQRERANGDAWQRKYAMLEGCPMILITGHRRESFGQGFENICHAIAVLSEKFADCRFVYPVHLNPNVQAPVRRILGDRRNVHLVAPAAYPEFVWLMDRSTLILTDSGGVQEEAPSLCKPVLVMRETTERPEAIEAGVARLVGTSADAIVAGVSQLLTDPAACVECQTGHNPYGDGHAAERIVELILHQEW